MSKKLLIVNKNNTILTVEFKSEADRIKAGYQAVSDKKANKIKDWQWGK